MAASRIDSAVTSLGCAASPPEGGSFRGCKRREGSRARLSSTTTAIRATSPRVSQPLFLSWEHDEEISVRRITTWTNEEDSRTVTLLLPLTHLPKDLRRKWTSSSRIHFGDSYWSSTASIRFFTKGLAFRASLIDCVSMNRRQAIVSDGSMLAIDGAGEELLTSFLAIVDLRSTR